MTNRPWPEVTDNPDHPKQLNLTTLTKESRKWCIVYFVLFSIFSLIASLELRFLSLKIFFMHFENGKDLVVRNPDIFCTNAILLWCKSNLNMTWNDRGIKKLWRSFKQKQFQVFQFEASKRNICIAVHEKVNYLPTVWKTMPSCTKVHIKHKYKWNNVQCSSCFKVFTKKLCQDHLKYIL